MPVTEETLLKKVAIADLFSSLQGEGPRLGERHLFIRFPACNLHCHYCDETGHPVEEIPIGELLSEVRALDRKFGPHAFISLTGGEPLLYYKVIQRIAPILRGEGFKFYLETAGYHVQELEQVLQLVDMISMDMKLPSVTKDRDCFREHRAFLRLSQSKEVYVKIVISTEASGEEFHEAVEIIREVNPRTLLVLQPMSVGEEKDIDPALLNVLYGLQSEALRQIENVRVIPRLHKVLGIK